MMRTWIAASMVLLAACAPISGIGLPDRASVAADRVEAALSLLPRHPDPEAQHSVSLLASRQGRVAIGLESLDAVLAEIAAGHAVVMAEGIRAPSVAAGFDLESGELLLVGGGGRLVRQPLAAWSRPSGDLWAVVVIPPGELPVAADCATYLRAVARLLQVGSPWEAVLAYDAGVARWPGDADALAGLGASLGGLGDRQGAAQALAAAAGMRSKPEKETSRDR